MSLDIIPCQILPGAGSTNSRTWEIDKGGATLSGLEKFAHLAYFQRERRINWARSFALKGLPYAPYRYQASVNPNRFHWILARDEDPSLPKEVIFLRSGDAQSALQGELLTYVTDRRVVQVEEAPSLILADGVSSAFFDRFPTDEWVSAEGRRDELLSLLLPEKRALFHAAVIARWVVGASAVRIAY